MASAQELVQEVRAGQKRRAVYEAVRRLDYAKRQLARDEELFNESKNRMATAQELFDKNIALIETGEFFKLAEEED